MSNKKRKYGDAWKNVNVDKVEVEQMNAIFDRFISPSETTPIELTKTIPEAAESSSELNKLPLSSKSLVDHADLEFDQNTITEENSDLLNDQLDLNISDLTSNMSNTRFSENLVPIAPSSQNQVLIEPSPNRTKLSENSLSKFYVIPNSLHDEFLPTLPPFEQLVFLRLYRLSIGFNKTLTDPVSYSKLAIKCNLSVSTVKRALQALEAKKLIKVLGEAKHNPIAGNQYELLINMVPLELSSIRTILERPSSNRTKFSQTSIKDHDDDPLKRQDHHQTHSTPSNEHQKRVMMIYQEITGNLWSKADHSNYEKIKHIPIDKIEVALRLAYDRATNRPNSFAFFIKEIIASVNPKTQSRTTRKKAMQKIVERVRNASVGSNISPSEFVYKVKEACLREDVAFENDLFNEVMSK
jgi:DNA-binding Lrp family transcriptional regulator